MLLLQVPVEEAQVEPMRRDGGRGKRVVGEEAAQRAANTPGQAELGELLAEQVVGAVEDGEDSRVEERLSCDVRGRVTTVAFATDQLLVVVRAAQHPLGGDCLDGLHRGERLGHVRLHVQRGHQIVVERLADDVRRLDGPEPVAGEADGRQWRRADRPAVGVLLQASVGTRRARTGLSVGRQSRRAPPDRDSQPRRLAHRARTASITWSAAAGRSRAGRGSSTIRPRTTLMVAITLGGPAQAR